MTGVQTCALPICEEETDVEIETTSETKGTKQEQEESTEEDPSLSLFSHKIYDWIQKSISLGQF